MTTEVLATLSLPMTLESAEGTPPTLPPGSPRQSSADSRVLVYDPRATWTLLKPMPGACRRRQ